MDKDFVSQGTPDDEVPEEFKVLIAACVIQLTFGLETYWLPDLEKIITYPRLFPTRQRPTFHAGEAHDDGCMILSGMMTRQGMTNSQAYYHIGLHTAAEYWHLRNPVSLADLRIADEQAFVTAIEEIRLFKTDFWRELTGIYTQDPMAIAAFDTDNNDTDNNDNDKIMALAAQKDHIRRTLAIESDDDDEEMPVFTPLPIPCFELAVECFFTKPHEMAQRLPDTFAALMQILRQDPREDTYPVLK